MKRLGAIANIQPQFVTTDARWIEGALPEELLPWAYAWKSLIDHGKIPYIYNLLELVATTIS